MSSGLTYSVSPAELAAWDSALGQLEGDRERERWARDPVSWAASRAGMFLWSKQREIAGLLAAHRKVAVQSCHGAGKTVLAAVIAAWWLDTHPVGEALVVSSAPSYTKVHHLLWHEIRRLHRKAGLLHPKAGLPGRVKLSDEWLSDDDELIGVGRKPPDYDEDAFQGYHRRYMLVILDEAGGIPPNIWTAVESITTNTNVRVLVIGNPDDNSSEFAKVCAGRPGWETVRINAWDTPNLTGEPVPDYLADLLVSREWVEDKLAVWGADNPLYIAKVLGLFSDAADGLIPLSWINAAQDRWVTWKAGYDGSHEPAGRRIFGVDVARFGEDKTAIATRQGHVVLDVERFSKFDTVATTGLVEARLVHPKSLAVVDADGVGGGVVDLLRSHRRNVVAYSGAAGTRRRDRTGTQRFFNTRSAAWWGVRELLDPAFDPTLCLPPDDQLAADLSTPKWPDTTGNVIKVELKAEITKRLGRSPDTGDAVVQALWVDAASVEQPAPGGKPRPRAVAYANSVGGWS